MKDTTFAIYHDLPVYTSAEKLFEAVADPEHLVNWWPLTCRGEKKNGGVYNFYFSPEYDWFGEVITYSPGKSFHIKMTRADQDWDPTSFGFDITETDGLCKLRFWHKGWPECNAHFRTSSYCWAILLNGLKNYVEKGIVVPFADRE